MNPHALSVLEFDQALEKVAARAASPMGRERIRALRPGTTPEAPRRELSRVSETLRVIEACPEWAPPPPPDTRSALQTLKLDGGVLDSAELLLILRLLRASRELSRALSEMIPAAIPPEDPLAREADLRFSDSALSPPVFPHLSALNLRLPVAAELERVIEGVADDEGQVRDNASDTLRGLRRSLRTTRSRVVRKLEGLLATLPDRIRVEGASVSVRDGRYVIPIRREGKSEVGGIIHGESATGATLFVEPPLAIQLLNEIHQLEREEDREVLRILRETTDRLRPHWSDLESGFEAQVDFDTLWARARSARRWGGYPPELLELDMQELRIRGGRHPLLLEQGVDVVPFFLEMGADERVIVVSGPNTGGKTVLLKAVGLIHLLAQSGIVPPVEPGTRLPVLHDVFADIGDEQSIAQSLSTFSAHLANAREILDGAGPGTLVLMDEMGTGTDPAEGAALARALLEILVARGARALVTSHLGALKRLDTNTSGIVNASLLFDAERIAPTYQLQKGRPGRSYGLAIARRLGLPAEALDLAERYVDSTELQLEGLLESLERRERELSDALRDAEDARRMARSMLEDVETREARLEERERTAEARTREQARRLLLDARREVEDAIDEVRSSAEVEMGRVGTNARSRVEAAARRQRSETRPAAKAAGAGSSASVSEGDRVRVLGSGAQGVVRELRDDRVTVEVGGLRLRVPRAEVEPTRGDGPLTSEATSSHRVGGWTSPELEVRSQVDLRGLRVDEVDLVLGRALDGAVVGNLAELRIIHGKGTGAVKARVRELLLSDVRVGECRPGGQGEGGAGVTVAVLR